MYLIQNNSPCILPFLFSGYTQSHSINSYEELNPAYNASTSSTPGVYPGSMGRTASVKKSIMKKQSECQYAQLVFDQPSSSSNSRTFATDDSVLYVNPSPQHRRHRGETNYATIDHSRRHGGHGKPSSSKSGRSKGGLMHSASCPFKVKLVLAWKLVSTTLYVVCTCLKFLC